MKKVLSLFLAMVFVLGVWASVPITANAASTSDLIFEYNQHDDTYMVTGCKKTISGALTIPDTYKGVPVTDVMEFAFANTAITSVVCGNNIKSLGGGAFYNCKKLTSAKLPDRQIMIHFAYEKIDGSYYHTESGGKNPFSGTPIEQAAYNKGGALFYIGKHLIDVFPDRLGDTLKIKPGTISIPSFLAEYGRLNADYIEIPGSVKIIPEYAFYQERILTLSIGTGVKEIGASAFNRALINELLIPSTVETIGDCAFMDCTLKSVYIPPTVKNIGDKAFGYSIESIGAENNNYRVYDFTIYGSKGSAAEKYAKENSFKFVDLHYEVVTVGPLYLQVNKDDCYVVDYNCGLSSDTVIPSSYKGKPVTKIADEAFFEADNLKSVTIPGSVTRIGKWSFYGCDNLQKVVIADRGLKAIAKEAFIDCPKLKSFKVPQTVTFIGDCALGTLIMDGFMSGFTIYGETGSVAHTYAKEYGFKFVQAEFKPVTPEVKIANTSKGIKVSWGAVNGAKTYDVYRKVYNASTASWSSWVKIKSGYTSTSYTDKETLLGVKYKYTVKAVNGAGESGFVSSKTLKCDMAPTVKATNASNGVKLTWNKINGAQSYIVYKKTYNATTKEWSGWENIKSGLTSTSYTDKDVKFGVKYKYTAKAVRGDFKSSHKSTGTLQRNVSPVVKVANKASGVKVSWNSVYGAQKYIVYRKTYNATTKAWGSWECLNSSCTATNYTDTKALLGVKYKYTAVAVRDDFKGSFKESDTIQRNASPAVKISNKSNGIKVEWSSVYGAQSYIVYRKTYNASTEKWGAWESINGKCTTTSYVDTKAALGAKYMYTVVAVRNGVNSSFVATDAIKRNTSPVVKTANKADGINVTWNKITGAKNYVIYRKTYNASTKEWSGWKNVKSGCTSTGYVDKTALLGVKYQYTVRAVNGSFKSSYKGTKTLQRNVSPVVSVLNQAKGVNVTWNSVYGAQKYIVYRKTYNDTTKAWGSWEALINNYTATSYMDKTALLGERYKYTVVAVRNNFKSTFAETPLLQRNVAPAVTIAKQSNGIKVNWSSVYGAQKYTVYRQTYNNTTKSWGSWEVIKSGCTDKSMVDTSVKNGTYYRYTVCGVRNNFQGSFVQSSVLQYVK